MHGDHVCIGETRVPGERVHVGRLGALHCSGVSGGAPCHCKACPPPEPLTLMNCWNLFSRARSSL